MCQIWSKLIEKWPPKILDGRHEIEFFDISTSDRSDFPRILEIALFFLFLIQVNPFLDSHLRNDVPKLQSCRLNRVTTIERTSIDTYVHTVNAR